MDHRVRSGEIPEDQVTALMESYSAKLPTSFFLGAAIASIAASLSLKAMGIYNKMVKQHGSDASVGRD